MSNTNIGFYNDSVEIHDYRWKNIESDARNVEFSPSGRSVVLNCPDAPSFNRTCGSVIPVSAVPEDSDFVSDGLVTNRFLNMSMTFSHKIRHGAASSEDGEGRFLLLVAHDEGLRLRIGARVYPLRFAILRSDMDFTVFGDGTKPHGMTWLSLSELSDFHDHLYRPVIVPPSRMLREEGQRAVLAGEVIQLVDRTSQLLREWTGALHSENTAEAVSQLCRGVRTLIEFNHTDETRCPPSAPMAQI